MASNITATYLLLKKSVRFFFERNGANTKHEKRLIEDKTKITELASVGDGTPRHQLNSVMRFIHSFSDLQKLNDKGADSFDFTEH